MQDSRLRIILLVAFVDLIGFGLIIPLQAAYAQRLGATGLTFGCLVGIYAAMQLIFNPVLGRLSDRIGRRPVLLVSLVGSVLSHLLLGVADLAGSLQLLFLARILDGITGANIATAQACIADVTTAENRAKGMGKFGAAFGLGFVLGPALAALSVVVGRQVQGPQYATAWPAFVAAIMALIASVIVWRYLPETRIKPKSGIDTRRPPTFSKLFSVMHQPRIRELFTLALFGVIAFVLLEATFVYLCVDRFQMSEVGVGLIFVYFGMIMVVVQGGLVGRLSRRFGEPRLVAVGPMITAVGFLTLSLVPIALDHQMAWWLLLVGCVPVAFGHGITGPNMNALISRQAGPHEQGAMLGLSQSVGSLGRTIAPPIGGLLYDIGPSWPYWVGAVIFLAAGSFGFYIRPAQQAALSSAAPEDGVATG